MTARGRALVSAWPGEVRAVVTGPDGSLRDLLIQRDDKPSIMGNLYLGRVLSVDRGLQSAFVELGLERPGLLPLKGAAEGLREGETCVVRVVREPGPGKGAKLRLQPGARPAKDMRAPALLGAGDPLADLLRTASPAEIRVEGSEMLRRLRTSLPELAERLVAHAGPGPLLEGEGFDAEIDALLEPLVPLPSGGRLRIEPVETLTAIDVDSGAHDGRGGHRAAALELDLAAAAEIARQARLRALSGLIVIDFLELPSKRERVQVRERLVSAFAGDPVATDVGPMRASGLVEVARARARLPLYEILTEPCGRAGRLPDAVSVAFELIRAADREGRANPGAALVAVAQPAVIEAIARARPARARLERRLGRPLELRGDPVRGREDWEILVQ